MKGVGHVDPGADAVVICQTREEGEGQRCAAGAFGAGEFSDRSDGKAALEGVVKGGDAGRGCRTDDTRGWSERGWDAVGKGGFDLLAEVGSGWHAAALSPYIRLLWGEQARGFAQGEL